MSNYEYCKKWFIAKKLPIDVMTCEDALKLHKSLKPYTVVIKDAEGGLNYLISVTKESYLVSFFDALLNIYLVYQFNVVVDKLFLAFATHHEYDLESGKVVEKTVYSFKQDGSLYIEKRDYLNSVLATAESEVDVSRNWEAIPEFGNYYGILKENR